MATTFITSPSNAATGSTATLQNLSSSSAALRPHPSSATTTITATANVIERPSSSAAARNNQQSSFASSQFTLSAKAEVPEEAAMITIQSGSSGGGGSSDNGAAGVQYLTDGEQIYATTNGQLRQYSQYVTESASPSAASGTAGSLATGTTTYYDPSGLQVVQPAGRGGSSAVTPKMVGGNQLAGLASGVQGQLVTHQGGTYILQAPSSTMLSGGENNENGLPLQHMTRASPATVQWLLEHFEPSEGVSLARCTLYSHYRRHCAENCVEEMNAASFGKLIRSVFVNLKTRRLGTRGNSKYHYYGIRVKPNSPLNQYNDDAIYPNMNSARGSGGGAGAGYAGAVGAGGASAAKKYRSDDGSYGGDGQNEQQNQQYYAGGSGTQAYHQLDASQQARVQEHQQYLGDPSVALTEFPGILSGNVKTTERQIELPDGISVDDLLTFESLYRDHCESILDIVYNLQFSLMESLWSSFWKRDDDGEDEMEDQLPKFKLMLLCKMELIQSYMRQCDHVFYQSLVEVLIPDVLRPIPSSLTQAIRNFAKSLDGWANSTLNELPRPAFRVKFAAINAFSQTLRRYTSLNHLAQAARAVLQNNGQIAQMLSDLNRVDFASVQEQAAWVCQCEDSVVTNLEKNFKVTLQAGTSLEDWAGWLEAVVDQVLKTHQGSPNFAKAARQFLLKWSFYSSMVIRDLTLRSAASFGSFHLIRLLYDEYMFFLIEHKVAQSLGETPIGVMGNSGSLGEAGASMMVVGGGNDLVDLAATTTPPEDATSLPRGGANIDALLIDHEMLTKPTFEVSAPSSGLELVAAKAAAASSAASVAKLNSIPASTTINNNINANSITTPSVHNLIELQTNTGPNGVIQTPAPTEDHQRVASAEVVHTVQVSSSASLGLSGQKMSDDRGQVLASVPLSSQTSSSSSTTSLVSSSSVLSLSTPVGVIKQAGSGAAATAEAAPPPAAVVASATIVGGCPTAVAGAGGQTYVVVQAPENPMKTTIMTTTGSATTTTATTALATTKPTLATFRILEEENNFGRVDCGEPAAKRIKTE